MKRIMWLVLLLCGCSAPTYKVVKISDGDTITILKDGKEERVRLAEIDCPERGQAYYSVAKTFTGNAAFGKQVSIKVVKEKDQYGRMVAEVILPDGKVLNEEIVKAGFAWHYKTYSNSAKLAALEKEARDGKIGLWADEHAVPPWKFRRTKVKNANKRE